MPLRRNIPLLFMPRSLTDAVDSTPVRPGAMLALSNLIPDPSTDSVFIARPAAIEKTDFTGVGITPGNVSALLVVGDTAYGMIGDLASGKDYPFAFDIPTSSFYAISGVAGSVLPTSQPTTGNWTPPIMAQVGSRIIVVHPGFPGGAVKFGWIDISSANVSFTGNITSGSHTITGNPPIIGISPGFALSAAGIPVGTTVVSTAYFNLTTTCDTANGSTTLSNFATLIGVVVGQSIAGTGILPGTTITSVGGTSVTISQAATATATGVTVQIAGASITMSHNATASTNNLTIIAFGGIPTNPQWGSGDTDLNPLPAVPVHVDQFNGRAYYALGSDGIVWSDVYFACRVSNTIGVQAWTPADGLAITALGQLGVSTLTGGIVQGLIAFAGVSRIYQILGDQSTGNLTFNALQTASGTGTEAPLSICPTEIGLAYISPQGLRVIDFQGKVTQPIGYRGAGVVMPFINAAFPSRICGASNASVLRFSVQRVDIPETPVQEFWYDLSRDIWTGPHNFPATQVQPYSNTFIMASEKVSASLWISDIFQSVSSQYIENGVQMAWEYRPTPLPDTKLVAMNCIVELMIAVGGEPAAVATARDFNHWFLDTVPVSFGAGIDYQQIPINWTKPLVFKQLDFSLVGNSSALTKVGNLYMRYQILGYKTNNFILLLDHKHPGVMTGTGTSGPPVESDIPIHYHDGVMTGTNDTLNTTKIGVPSHTHSNVMSGTGYTDVSGVS